MLRSRENVKPSSNKQIGWEKYHTEWKFLSEIDTDIRMSDKGRRSKRIADPLIFL